MNKVKALFTPSWEKANPYQRLLKEACEAHGCDVSLSNYPSGFFPFYKLTKQYPDLDVMHIHWISELLMRLVWSKNPLLFYLKYCLFGLDCWLVKRKGIKLIWTIHNKFAHESQHRKRELKIRVLLSRCANKVILHSKEALEEINNLYGVNLDKKSEIIFHGNYENFYPIPTNDLSTLKSSLGINNDEMILLFFGGLKPYKGVETLIAAFHQANNVKLKLIVAGEPQTTEYKNSLEVLINKKTNIITKFHFLDDQELSDYLTLSDAVVLPFADTLTSGSAILSMTFGKALILSDSAKVFGCVPEQGALYFQNLDSLTDIINTIDKEELVQMSTKNKAKAFSMNWHKVGEMTSKVYRR